MTPSPRRSHRTTASSSTYTYVPSPSVTTAMLLAMLLSTRFPPVSHLTTWRMGWHHHASRLRNLRASQRNRRHSRVGHSGAVQRCSSFKGASHSSAKSPDPSLDTPPRLMNSFLCANSKNDTQQEERHTATTAQQRRRHSVLRPVKTATGARPETPAKSTR